MMDELLTQFLIEAPELVQQGSDALLALERDPGNRSLTDDAFRAIHTLKGSVGLFDFPAMATTLHAAEDVLGAVRSGVRAADAPTIDALLATLTQVDRWLDAIQSTGTLGEAADQSARRLADQLTAGGLAGVDVRDAAPAPSWALDLQQAFVDPAARTAIRYSPAANAYFNGDDPVALMERLPDLLHLRVRLGEAPSTAGPYDPFVCRLVIEALTGSGLAEARAVLRLVPDQIEVVALPQAQVAPAESLNPIEAGKSVRTLRVDASRVEDLAAMADDLVALATGLAGVAALAREGARPQEAARAIIAHSESLDRLAGRLHRQVMGLRMTPVAPLLRRLPRVVRDLARALKREVDLIVEDNGVEADKAVVEGLFEPLTHLLRNAVDHGIEPPAVREAAGKPRNGTIRLGVAASGGDLELTLSDDGAGIDPAAVRAAVAARGLMPPETLSALDDAEAVNLIFLPGLSTARETTDVSGRGVGMDAVRAAIQRLGGAIRMDGAPGRGVTARITLPLRLMLTKVLIATSEGEAWGLPMDRVAETLRVPAAAVTPIRAGKAFAWRDRTVPLISLSRLVGGGEAAPKGDWRVLVVRVGSGHVGVAVDEITARADVVVRPLDGLLAGLPGVSGMTLTADGRVLMILDVEALVG